MLDGVADLPFHLDPRIGRAAFAEQHQAVTVEDQRGRHLGERDRLAVGDGRGGGRIPAALDFRSPRGFARGGGKVEVIVLAPAAARIRRAEASSWRAASVDGAFFPVVDEQEDDVRAVL